MNKALSTDTGKPVGTKAGDASLQWGKASSRTPSWIRLGRIEGSALLNPKDSRGPSLRQPADN